MKIINKYNWLKVDRRIPVYFLSMILLFISCRKDKVSTDKQCMPIIECNQVTQGGGYVYEVDFSNIYASPKFNPNNENEFLYLKEYTPDQNSTELYIYNLANKEKTLIYTGSNIWYSPQWNQNNWILFSKSDKNIYLIKSSGDSLTQLTNEGCYHHPLWYFENNKIIAYNECLQNDIVFDFEGNILDTLPQLINAKSSLSKYPYLVNNSDIQGQIKFYNYQLESQEFFYDYSQEVNSSAFMGGGGGEVFWLTNDELAFSNSTFGIKKLFASSFISQTIKSSCNSKIYKSGDINASKSKMIWSRGDYIQIDECTLKYEQGIYIMNIDGTEEERIDN